MFKEIICAGKKTKQQQSFLQVKLVKVKINNQLRGLIADTIRQSVNWKSLQEITQKSAQRGKENIL